LKSGVFCIRPNSRQVSAAKAALVLLDGVVIEDFVNGIGSPGGFEDDGFGSVA
jgi:hypothetical protein